MASLIEFHGRLFRVSTDPGADIAQADVTPRQRNERIAEPGSYDLQIALHGSREDTVALWSEVHRAVPVSIGGYFGVVLGALSPVPPGFFDGTPRWLSATGRAEGADTQSARVPLLGHAVRVMEQLLVVNARISALEVAQAKTDRRSVNLHRRMSRAEKGARLGTMDARLTRLDGTDGRLAHLEDEIEDVVGPDGDMIDVIERLERLEGVRPGKASVDPKTVEDLVRKLDELTDQVRLLARPRK
ncbi:MAG: hypothetical protein EXR69_00815 [Myxococcales bacterium]|nr:hypothetical protein [Myxococcales bacterium]